MTKKIDKKGFISKKEDYSVSIKYNKKAIDKKLVKFSFTGKKDFEISVDSLIELITQYVNSKDLGPLFVDTEKINIVYVKRQMKARLDRDFKAGEEISLEYSHPYPLEFALIEEGFKIAKVENEKGMIEITPEVIKKAMDSKNKKENDGFLKKFYQTFKNITLGGDT